MLWYVVSDCSTLRNKAAKMYGQKVSWAQLNDAVMFNCPFGVLLVVCCDSHDLSSSKTCRRRWHQVTSLDLSAATDPRQLCSHMSYKCRVKPPKHM